MQLAQFQLHAEIEERHWWFVARRRIVQDLARRVLPPTREALVLDVGCGAGANAAALASEYRVVGIDTSADAVRLAAERFPHVRFLQGFAPADVPADVLENTGLVLLMDVLEHVPDDFALLSELLAALQPGAHLLMTVPAEMALWTEHDESFGHYRRYDLRRFTRLWQGLPVTPLLATHYNARLYPLVKTARTWNRWRGKAAGRAGTDFALPPASVNRLLTRAFAGESQRLTRMLETGVDAGYRAGVSLIAILRREEGELIPRRKPADAALDHFDPVRGELLVGAGV
jgi:SAM-dependent methyltransferase